MRALGLWVVMAVAAVVLAGGGAEARHHHAVRHQPRAEDVWDELGELPAEEQEAPAHESANNDSVKSSKHAQLVPINTRYFNFAPAAPAPCRRDGFRRDRFGICREVW